MGAEPEAQRPRGTVTFLFTDVEGSTRLWTEQGHGMRDAMALHDRLVGAAIEANSGYVFTTAGDSFAAAFDRAADAVRAAVETRRAVRDASWPAGVTLSVRTGLHTGEADERDGDYFGSAVNRAARLMSAAHGGQIVVSGATRDVLADAVSPEIDLAALGPYTLQGFDQPVEVFEVIEEADRSEPFLRLRIEQDRPGNVPVRLEPLVGRENDMAAVLGQLEEHDLVTITGVGGIGKSRLALACAADRRDAYEHGVWVCELAPVARPEAVAQSIAHVIGARQHPNRTMADSVAEYCRRRRMLLVLDNCEHVLDAAGDVVEALLTIASGVQVIATSRERLDVDGEHAHQLEPLPSSGTAAPAVQLFRLRAASVVPDLVWGGDELAAAERVCARLDGIPLAIELAATRARSLDLATIEQHLDQAFRVLRGGRRNVERHRTLEAAIDWSYEALPHADQALFDRLSVFAGGFDLAAARAVCADGEETSDGEIIDQLDDLVAKSLLATERIEGAVRFRLLEPLRQYAEHRLALRGEVEQIRQRHLDHFVGWAEEWRDEIPIEGHGWRQRLERDFANLRAAIRWAIANDDATAAARIILALGLAHRELLMFEIGDWAVTAVGMPGMGRDRLGPLVAVTAAMSCWWRADPDGFVHYLDRGTAMPVVDAQPRSRAVTGGLTGIRSLRAMAAGDDAAALAALELIGRQPLLNEANTAWSRVGHTLHARDGELARQRADELDRLEHLTRTSGSALIESMYRHGQARDALVAGEHSTARAAARRGIDAALDVGAPFFVHHNVNALAHSLAWTDDWTTEELRLIADTLREQRDAGQVADQWLILSGAAGILYRHGSEQLSLDVHHGLLGTQWHHGHSTTSLGELLDLLGAPVDDSTEPNAQPDLDDLVDRTLAAIDDLITTRDPDAE